MVLDIVTPERKIFSGEIDLLSVPGTNGHFEVLHNHAPILSLLEEGQMKVVTHSGEKKFYKITSGIVEVKNNKIIVLAEHLQEKE